MECSREDARIGKPQPGISENDCRTILRGAPAVLRAWKKGIPLVAGTDTSDRTPFTVSSEVAEFVKIGIPPMYAIQGASFRAAALLGISERTGSIKPGYEADLLVIDGNPLADIGALKKVVLVINDGQVALNRFVQ